MIQLATLDLTVSGLLISDSGMLDCLEELMIRRLCRTEVSEREDFAVRQRAEHQQTADTTELQSLRLQMFVRFPNR